ncbi:MAG: hypothetical protein RLZZ360_686 [Candidatus Parcubacteria bacterium]|jgi:hypothetical protein
MFFGLMGEYYRWHYTNALIVYLRILKNFWWFIVAYFSIPLLIKTLFVPYKRMTESSTRTISSWLEARVMNTLSRLVGLLVRSCLLITGLISLGALIGIGVCGYMIWLGLPILTILLGIYGGVVLMVAL